ncbi:MAG: hypothetical protein QMC83_10200, partial [Thermodesulfovibrionales bacterium]|nr:hypothetical protein [Thermodesulfovibrionales bacterium]
MAVPAHDQRDFDFARKYNLPMIKVIKNEDEEKELLKRAPLVVSNGRYERAYEGEGYLVNSGRFDGMSSEMAREEIGKWLEKKGQAQKKIYYKLRNWLISRQRYWGCPIPLIFCEKCKKLVGNPKSEIRNPKLKGKFNKGELLNPGWIAVSEKELPVLLPKIKDYLPIGEGKSPLAKSKKFVETICPKCRGAAKRETDTMDTFVCSSWYYLAYAFWHKLGNQKSKLKNQKSNKKNVFRKWKNLIKAWLPVDLYIGGAEHAVMHLLYARFFTKVLKNLGKLNFNEPFLKL